MATTPDKVKPKQQGNGQEQSKQAGSAMMPQRRGGSMAPYAWEPFNRMRTEFDRLFDRFFPGAMMPWEGTRREWHWGLDVHEQDDAVVVHAEAPGFEPADFDLQVRGDQLILSASHKAETEEKERGFHEWHRQEFFRSVPLSTPIDADKVEANYRNGVLTVKLPKTEESKARRITVQG